MRSIGRSVGRGLRTVAGVVFFFQIIYIICFSAILLWLHSSPQFEGGIMTVLKPDERLGYSARPDAEAVYRAPSGAQVATICTSEIGARESCSTDRSADRDGTNLFIGGSFTFGDGVDRDQTYAALVSDSMHHLLELHALGGYGLAHFELIARRWIPRHRPDCVFIQLSSWSIDRSTRRFSLTFPWTFAVPFYTGDTRLRRPIGTNRFLRLGQTISSAERTPSWIMRMIWEAVPATVADQWTKVRTMLRSNQVAPDDQLVDCVLHRITHHALRFGTQVVVIGIESPVVPGTPGVLFIDASSALHQVAGGSDSTYEEMFHHADPETGEFYDSHPNRAAHKLMAVTILQQLR